MTPTDLSTIRERLVLRGGLECMSGLRIGAAKDSGGSGSDLPVLRDGRGLPYIPGSSFKGVLRSTVESLVRAAAVVPQLWGPDNPPSFWSCDPLCNPEKEKKEDRGEKKEDARRTADEACMSRRWKKVLLDAHRENRDGRNSEELAIGAVLAHTCTVCGVFGNTELGGRILVADLLLENLDALTSPVEVRDGVGIDRDLLTARDGLKYDYEVVPAGARFGLEIVLDNADAVQRGLVAAGLEAIHEGYARVGGFGSRGLGRVKIEVSSITLRSARQMLAGGEGTNLDWDSFIRAGHEALQDALPEGGEHA